MFIFMRDMHWANISPEKNIWPSQIKGQGRGKVKSAQILMLCNSKTTGPILFKFI